MITSYFKQALQLLKNHWFLSCLSILGTATSICLIMLYISGYQCKWISVGPEVNRSRTLYVKWVGVKEKGTLHTVSNAFLSLQTIRNCFESLSTPEAVGIATPIQQMLAAVPKGSQTSSHVRLTNHDFFNVFLFEDMQGQPYSQADVEAGIHKAVISERLAKQLFGTTDVLGKDFYLSYRLYTICAVVKDVTTLSNASFADVWIPYTSTTLSSSNDYEGTTGIFKCYILARQKSDFERIRREAEQKMAAYNATLSDYEITFYSQPDTKFQEDFRFGPGNPDIASSVRKFVIFVCILLIVPAINLSEITRSRMEERREELAIRKSFGARRNTLVAQIIRENMLPTLLGGALGLLFSYGMITLLKEWLFSSTNYLGVEVSTDVSLRVFINPTMFLIAFLFCALLNIMSSAIPAWKIASSEIVQSLKS